MGNIGVRDEWILRLPRGILPLDPCERKLVGGLEARNRRGELFRPVGDGGIRRGTSLSSSVPSLHESGGVQPRCSLCARNLPDVSFQGLFTLEERRWPHFSEELSGWAKTRLRVCNDLLAAGRVPARAIAVGGPRSQRRPRSGGEARGAFRTPPGNSPAAAIRSGPSAARWPACWR